MREQVIIFWFRRDLRLQDNCGLYHALSKGIAVLPIFIFDRNIIDDLADKRDARLSFIHRELGKINETLKTKGSKLKTIYAKPEEAFTNLLKDYDVNAVYTNRDYEPYAYERDENIRLLLEKKGVEFKTYKDQVIFERNEIVKDNGSPYLVYTPYSKKWLAKVSKRDLEPYPTALLFDNWVKEPFEDIMSLKEMGFQESAIKIPTKNLETSILKTYQEERDFPSKDSTSRIGVHLRFGTISIREVAQQAASKSLVFYKELIWREFFMMILFHYPRVINSNFNRKYDAVKWRNNEEDFERWKNGRTGYPLVDAGMRELNNTGFMHSRVRMVVASFLCKHLLIDWKWGEGYFAEKLLDYDLSANNGNWQWAAGTGVDAAPYFRVFNPTTQIEKFDKQELYIKKWVENYQDFSYPSEIVEHKYARERALKVYKDALI